MEITDILNALFSAHDFKIGFFMALPLGLCIGFELTFLIEDLIDCFWRKLRRVKEWHERFDN